jgi:hypothetical protein
VSVQFGRWGVRGGGPDHGGGPLLSFEHIRFPNDFNPVNHPFRLSEMTESALGNLPGARSSLDQASADGVAHQTRCFVDLQFLHESCSV